MVRKLLSRLCDVNATHVKESNAHADEESQRALAKSRIDGRLAGGPRPERGEPLTQVPIEAISRVSPALDGDQVIIGDILSSNQIHDGANVIAVDRKSGKRRWITQVDSHPSAIITGSPVVFDGVVYLGVSSSEETLATNPAYPCCTFRGSVVALDARSGAMLWQTFDMPDNGGQQGDTAAERCGSRRRSIQNAARSSSVPATTTSGALRAGARCWTGHPSWRAPSIGDRVIETSDLERETTSSMHSPLLVRTITTISRTITTSIDHDDRGRQGVRNELPTPLAERRVA